MFPSTLVHALYPIGLIANLVFGTAFSIQWILSERRRHSCAPKIFWIFSLAGAVLMIFHGIIQSQFLITLLYSINFIIYFRHLNMHSKHRIAFSTTLLCLGALVLVSSSPFLIGALFLPNMQWMAAPNVLNLPIQQPTLAWQCLGSLGLITFSSRFFIQWYRLETYEDSSLSEAFWIAGLLGGVLTLAYFIRVGDPVNILGYSCGIVPTLANLRILRRKKRDPLLPDNSFFFSAGEMSGDILGANLLRSLRDLYPDTQFFGVGGPHMRAEGLHPILRMEDFQVSGFLEVATSFVSLYRKYRYLYKSILKANPKVVVCIDFPDFHLLLVKKLRKKGFKGKIIHYVCPSIWAWRPKRKATLEKYLDALFLILPFEKELFAKSTLQTAYLGHPLIQSVQEFQHNASWKDELGISSLPIIAAFPGSRKSDIIRNLHIHIRAFMMSSLAQTHQLLVSSSHEKYDSLIQSLLDQEGCKQGKVVPSRFRYELMRDCDCALAKCGTIVLETALNQTPTIVTCLLRPFDVFLAKYVFRIFLKAYSLPNLIMSSYIFPEFIGGKEDCMPEEIAASLDLLNTDTNRTQQKLACEQLGEIMLKDIVDIQEVFQRICAS